MTSQHSTPQELGFNSDIIAEAYQAVKSGVTGGIYPGATLAIGRGSGHLEPFCTGYLEPQNLRRVTQDSIYDVASLTKPVVTATLLLILLKQKKIALNDTVDSYLPNTTTLHEVTVGHLLTHTSGLPAHRHLHADAASPEDIIEAIMTMPLDNRPGTVYNYSCLGYILLGWIIETVTCCKLNVMASESVFEPLGMNSSMFNPGADMTERVAVTYDSPALHIPPVGIVHDENARAMGGVSGNAGLFSSATDLSLFCHEILGNRHIVLDKTALRRIFTNLIPTVGGHTAGWFTKPNSLLPVDDNDARYCIGHTGFTGSMITLDLTLDLYVILLTNRVSVGGRPSELHSIRRFIHNAVSLALYARR